MDIETRIGADVGGTFADVAPLTPEGRFVTVKAPSTDDQSADAVHGIERACDGAGIGPAEVDAFAYAMTVSVNAPLENDGATTALVTIEGFRDVLEIGRQARLDPYDVTADKPAPLVLRRRRFEVTERATVEGIQTEIDESEVRALADDIRNASAESVVVSLLYACRHPKNERAVADVFREELGAPVSASHEVLAEFREFERISTTAVDAYAMPAIGSYLDRLESRATDLGAPVPQIIQANGDVTPVSTVREHAVTTAILGPAVGVVGVAEIAIGSGGDFASLVTLDMGGTSNDVSLVRDGEAEWTTDAEISGRSIKTPMVDVNTVGVGGGSIAWADPGSAFRVGPCLSGANPGPACYGHGGTEPTTTNANVVLGYTGGNSALGGELSLDVDAARNALSGFAADTGLDDALVATRGVYRTANVSTTRAIWVVTVERGRDPWQFGLIVFGGAGPMHAAALAESLDIEAMAAPRVCDVLLAYGLLVADQKRDSTRTLCRPPSGLDAETVESAYTDLEADTLDDVTGPDDATVRRAADLRYVGQSFELTILVGEMFDAEAVEAWFHEAHESVYSYRLDDPVELANVRATAVVGHDPLDVTYRGGGDVRKDTREVFFDGELRETPVYDRGGLGARTTVKGPATLEQHENTVVASSMWGRAVGADETLVLTDGGDGERATTGSTP